MVKKEDIEMLSQLHYLREREIISEDEYEVQRRRILRLRVPFEQIGRFGVDLARVLALPAIALAIILYFGDLIRDRLSHSEEISYGSFSLKMRERAMIQGAPELANVVGRLSPEGLALLLNIGTTMQGIMGRNDVGKAFVVQQDQFLLFQELEGAGLLNPTEPLDPFWSFLQSLRPKATQRFRSRHNDTYVLNPSDYPYPSIEFQIEYSKLSEPDLKRIAKLQAQLSDKGRRAFSLIVETLTDQVGALSHRR